MVIMAGNQMNQPMLQFDEPTPDPIRPTYTTEEVISQLIAQIKRDLETLRMPLVYQSPNPEFYHGRIAAYRAEVRRLRGE